MPSPLRRAAAVQRTTLAVPAPFELGVALHGHGWVSLPPHRWDGGRAPWTTVLDLGGRVAAVEVRQGARGVAVTARAERALTAAQLRRLRATLRWMLRLDDDLGAFWRACSGHPQLAWVPRRGGGRLLRSPTVFEDLLKLLFTTNCTWSLTTAMARNLVAAAGPVGPAGERAFPSAAACDRGAGFFRDVVRAGYRAAACADLAERFATGDLRDEHFTDPALDVDQLRARLLALRGFGPYAAGQAMRLLGRYRDLALDSWCRARLAQLLRRRRPPSDAAVARRYRAFGAWSGLALWCELTAEWHGEGVEEGVRAR